MEMELTDPELVEFLDPVSTTEMAVAGAASTEPLPVKDTPAV